MNQDWVEELRRTVQETTERGLLVASRWASELLLSVSQQSRLTQPTAAFPLPPQFPVPKFHPSIPPQLVTDFKPLSPPKSPIATAPYLPPAPEPLTGSESQLELMVQTVEKDHFDAALALFEERNFLKAAAVLSDPACRSNRAMFLNLYSQYLESEKNAARQWHSLDQTRSQPLFPANESLPSFLDCLENVRDPYLLFLKALILIQFSRSPSVSSRRPEAIQCLLVSLKQRPWNWSAWLLLVRCIDSLEDYIALLPHLTSNFSNNFLFPKMEPILPPNHPCPVFFGLYTRLALHCPTLPWDAKECKRLLSSDWFPGNAWISTLQGGVAFMSRDYQKAHNIFSTIQDFDPYRIDHVDKLGGILFVSNNYTNLVALAMHYVIDVDPLRMRPEVCCVVAIHYSFRGDHEKALKHLRRAAELDPTDVNTWILMGQEYISIDNVYAAIQCYRRALDITRRDFRAWLGIAKAYKLLRMWAYVNQYLARAMDLQPGDWRVWLEQSCAYDALGKPADALSAAQSAHTLFHTDNPLYAIKADPTRTSDDKIRVIAMLGITLKKVGRTAESIPYHQKVVEICKQGNHPIIHYYTSLLECAEWENTQTHGDWAGAQTNCEKVIQIAQSVPAEEIARAHELSESLKQKIKEARLRR